MLVTELGMVTEVRFEQPLNADPPILITELGIVTEISSVHPKNALPAIPLVPSFTVMIVFSNIVPLYEYNT